MTLAAVVGAALAALGVYLVYTAVVFRAPMRGPRRPPRRAQIRTWMDQAGLASVSPGEAAAACGAVCGLGALAGWVLFAAPLPSVLAGLLATGLPLSAYKRRRQSRLEAAAEAWPAMLEEIRLRTGSLGRSVPQALFEAGRRAPAEWKPAFAGAEREWLLTTDFERTLALLKARLDDSGVDAVCETLAVAHELGGPDLDRRLADLVEDRRADLQQRRDAEARQAGVRFARRFVLLVPLGMSVAGLAIGTGRSAYTSAGGQAAVVVALLAVAGCWVWSGRLMRLPPPPRVFR